MRLRRLAPIAVALMLASSLVAATGSGAGAAPKQPPPLRILVTNDDGADAPGIDTLVRALRKIPGVQVTVVAPVANQTGASDKTTPGELQATRSTTGGAPSTAVAGFPADTVNYALDTLKLKPDVVISGINKGQNVGPGVPFSGTIGAARTAARRVLPALAVSQGYATDLEVPDYAPGARAAVKWLKEHRKALASKGKQVEAFVDNLNVPTCAAGTKPRGTLEVPIGTESNYIDPQDCASTVPAPATDVSALLAGYTTLTPKISF